MTLSALVDGVRVNAFLASYEQWACLRASKPTVVLPCCDSPGFFRISRRGTKHFVHKAGVDCAWRGETWQHERAKEVIALACHDAGYEVTTEFTAPDRSWRADVYAERGSARVAFEVQWSPQTMEETLNRQRRYEQSTPPVRGCWFFRRFPRGELAQAIGDPQTVGLARPLPAFALQVAENGECVATVDADASDRRAVPLDELTSALLRGQVQYREKITAARRQNPKITFVTFPCWRCGAVSHVYFVERSCVTACGIEIYNVGAAFAPEIRGAVDGYLKTTEAAAFRVRIDYASFGGHSRTPAFACHRIECGAVFGPSYVDDAMYSVLNGWQDGRDVAGGFETSVLLTHRAVDEYPHWCYPRDGEFCVE